MKILRRVALGFAVFALLLGAAVVYIAFTFDAARIKQDAEQVVLAKTGRTLTIDGNLALTFWPRLGLDMAKVTLSEHDSKQRFAALDAAHVSVSVIPLLSKKIVVDKIAIDGLNLVLIRDRDGHLNIEDLVGGKKENETVAPPQFDVAGVRVDNARLEWRDERAGSSLKIDDLDFSTGHAVGGADGLSVEALTLSSRGKFGADNIVLSLDVPHVVRKGEQWNAEKIGIKADLKGAARSAVASIDLSDIEGSLQAFKVGGLAFDVDAAFGDKKIKGDLKTPLDVDTNTSTLTLPALAGTLNLDMPGLPNRPLKLPIKGQIKVAYAKPALIGNLTTAFDETHVESRFNIAGGGAASIGLDLDIDKLNVDKYLPPAPAKAPASSDDRVDLSALKSLNASGSLRVGELQVKNIKARNVRIVFKAANGKVDIAPHSADLYEGQASGALSLNAMGNHVVLKETLSRINVQPLIKDVADKEMIEGKGDIALDVAMQGETVSALKKSLSGSASAALRDGAIKGINIAQTLRSAKAKLGGDLGSNVAQQASATDKTDFSELTASFKITNGVAHNEDLSAKSPFIRLGGSGDIDIGNNQLDYLLKAAVVSTAAGQGGKELDALKGLTVPVRVSGPFDKPVFKLELSNLVGDAAKARIEEKKDEVKQKVQQKVQDKLKDKLKGLF